MQPAKRTSNSIRNSLFGMGSQIIIVLIGFCTRSISLKYLSEDYLGLNGLFSNVISILSLTELGFGTAAIFSLYKPLAEKDEQKIAALMNAEEQLGIDKELIYATALLHDIGRHVQYADGTPHEIASAKLAPEILRETGFTAWEQEEILRAIREHRNAEIAEERSLAGIIYRADKASRACFACDVEKLCDWKAEKKNLEIRY